MQSLVDIASGLWIYAHNASVNPESGGWWNDLFVIAAVCCVVAISALSSPSTPSAIFSQRHARSWQRRFSVRRRRRRARALPRALCALVHRQGRAADRLQRDRHERRDARRVRQRRRHRDEPGPAGHRGPPRGRVPARQHLFGRALGRAERARALQPRAQHAALDVDKQDRARPARGPRAGALRRRRHAAGLGLPRRRHAAKRAQRAVPRRAADGLHGDSGHHRRALRRHEAHAAVGNAAHGRDFAQRQRRGRVPRHPLRRRPRRCLVQLPRLWHGLQPAVALGQLVHARGPRVAR